MLDPRKWINTLLCIHCKIIFFYIVNFSFQGFSMKLKFLGLFFLTCISCLVIADINQNPDSNFAEYMQQGTEQAIVLAKDGCYSEAIEKYSELIDVMESSGNEIDLKLYNLRGDLFFAIRDYQNALKDFQKIPVNIENATIDETSEILKAACGRMFSFDSLDNDLAAENEFKSLVQSIVPVKHQLEQIDWIRDCSLSNHSLSLKKSEDCVPCASYKDSYQAVSKSSAEVESCQTQCTGYAVGASWACSRVPVPAIQFLCVGAIFGLERTCHWCCKDEGFWERCVKPLRRLLHDPEHPQNPAPHPYE